MLATETTVRLTPRTMDGRAWRFLLTDHSRITPSCSRERRGHGPRPVRSRVYEVTACAWM